MTISTSRNSLLVASSIAVFAGMALASSCPGGDADGGGDETPDASIEIVDSGLPLGEGEGERDAGTEGGGEGEGEGEGPVCDGGLCVDAGVSSDVYSGTPEPGVVCGASTCETGQVCCVVGAFTGITATCIASDGTCTGGLLNPVLRCDGPEDCGAEEECCVNLVTDLFSGGPDQLSSSCVAAGTCRSEMPARSEVCVSGNDCEAAELCCGYSVAALEVPVDLGVCEPAVNNCALANQ